MRWGCWRSEPFLRCSCSPWLELGDSPVTMTLLMRAAASSRSTGFVSCFRRFSITRRPRNTSPDSASSLGARTETQVLLCSAGNRLGYAVKCNWHKFSAQQAPAFLQLQPSHGSPALRSPGRSSPAKVCAGRGKRSAGPGWLKPAGYSIQYGFLSQSQSMTILKHNYQLSLPFDNSFGNSAQ